MTVFCHSAPSNVKSDASVFACAVAAVVLRAFPWRGYISGDGVPVFFGPDCYDHLRRVLLGVDSFPGFPPHDHYYGFPAGTGQIWAPLFDYLVSLIALAIGWGTPSPELVAQLCFWLPPVLGGLTVMVVYQVTRLLFGRTAGVAAASIIAVLPGHVLYSVVGRFDHHVAEPLLCLLLIRSLYRGVTSPEQRISPLSWLPISFWLVFSLLVWRGSVIFWGIAFVSLAAQAVPVPRKSSPAAVGIGGRAFLAAGGMLLPVCFLDPWNTSGGISSTVVSWFHPILLSLCGVLLLALGRLRRERGLRAWFPVLLGVIVLGLLAGPRFFSAFKAGMGVIGGADPWLGSIAELLPMLWYRTGRLDFWFPVQNLSFLYWVFPAVILLAGHEWRKSDWNDFRYPLFITWSCCLWLLPLFRFRYTHLAAVAVAVGGGFLLARLLEAGRKIDIKAAPAAAGCLLLFFMSPTASLLRDLPAAAPESATRELFTALRWLRDNSPETSFRTRPDTVPEYGVLADWGLGAYIVNLAERPTLATNFGWETHGLYESAAFQALGDPEAAALILSSNRIRYVVLNRLMGNLETSRRIAAHGFETGRLKIAAKTGFRAEHSMYHRLLVEEGKGFDVDGDRIPPLRQYRLLYDSGTATSPEKGLGLVKIFEFVAGAVITGSAPQGIRVELALPMEKPDGSVLLYTDTIRAGADGSFAFRVPYPTTSSSGHLQPVGDYRVTVAGRKLSARVSAEDVAAGRAVAAR